MRPTPLILAVLLAACLPARAAEADIDVAGPEPKQGVEIMTFSGMPWHGRLVKNAPYSAEVINESTQTLGDGNQITRKSSSMSYRDSQGRTRQETRDNQGELRVITIRDDQATWILHPSNKSATRIGDPREVARAAAEAARVQVETLRKDGKLARVERSDRNGATEIIVKRVEPGLETHMEENVRVQVTSRGEDGDIGERVSHIVSAAVGDARYARHSSTRDLGSKVIEGVKADGKLRSYEIPAGEIGNKNPIVVSDESWYAPELQVTVYSKHSDPRSGERIYRLANLKREEPAASLFAVPADYTVRDPMARAREKR